MENKKYTVVGIVPGFLNNPWVGWYECTGPREAFIEACVELAASDLRPLDYVSIFEGHLQDLARKLPGVRPE